VGKLARTDTRQGGRAGVEHEADAVGVKRS
jgi:hypothetical protein